MLTYLAWQWREIFANNKVIFNWTGIHYAARLVWENTFVLTLNMLHVYPYSYVNTCNGKDWIKPVRNCFSLYLLIWCVRLCSSYTCCTVLTSAWVFINMLHCTYKCLSVHKHAALYLQVPECSYTCCTVLTSAWVFINMLHCTYKCLSVHKHAALYLQVPECS